MHFKFDANQDFQTTAIESIAALLQGQPRIDAGLQLHSYLPAVANRLDLSEANLLANLQAVQAQNNLPPDAELIWIESPIDSVEGARAARFANFSIEMETGTGKTYVYLRTALELYRRYGLRKFIVVVPSVAVREGVLKTLEMTHDHLRALYDNVPYRYYAYDSANLSQVRQFALADSVEIMVMTIDSFNKASNVIRNSTDRLSGDTPIHLVQAARPILILDEPQNMESELRIKALAALDPLFALRYSATHRNPYNLIYRLTPFEAYRQGLVKRIEVAGVEKQADANLPFLRLDEVRTAKRTLTARIALHKLMAGGTVKEQVVTVKPGDSLEDKADRPEYAPFVVEEIDAGDGFVRFTNGLELRRGEAQGADKEAIFQAQIEYTIQAHIRKQLRVKDQGIKVLSLFFIDRVDNYFLADGMIRRLFNESLNRLKAQYPDWASIDPEKLQAAYFAARSTRSGETIFEDSKTGESDRDRETYDLIMRDKERLLSFDEPTCFIFSHSALREGWDNPNIFQICTLNQTTSEIKKRQEIGRGVRLAVNQDGDRIREDKVNVLTVVANESYDRYVQTYQSELTEDFGGEVPPPPANARQRGIAQLRKAYLLKPEFKALWDRIRQRTRYAVKIDSDKLIADVVNELDTAEIRPPQIVVTKAEVQIGADDVFAAYQKSLPQAVMNLAGRYPLPNLIEIMESLLAQTTPPVCLTRGTLLAIFERTQKQSAAIDNPHEFASVTAQIIKRHLIDQLVDGIQYEKIDRWYEMTQFDLEVESWRDYLVPSQRPDDSDGASLYDQVAIDSDIEREFVQGLERMDAVKLYFKLPRWFEVDTPLGKYNPDWAILLEQEAKADPKLYLVRETKNKDWLTSLRPDELRKIKCGARHFGSKQFGTTGALEGVDYKVVSDVQELLP